MATRPSALLLAAALLGGAAPGCDRAVEPYDPDQAVEAPDLSKIFPPGAERAPEDAGGDFAVTGARGGAAAGADTIRGTIELSPELEGRVPADGVAFLIARGGAGGPPLAVKRIPAPSFPLPFEIGPEDRMIEAIPFEGPMQLSVRIDADGNASSRTPGDLQGRARDRHEPGARDVAILVDEVL